ncbi:MAG: hypothetical protein QNJ98_18820 [Planctomycetota bacterium]|nr:hypothetical protein [Planctomycetota bacterium]
MEIPSPEHRRACLARLEHAVQRLALDAAQQVAQYPGIVVVADELALDFDHWLSVCASNDYVEVDLLDRLREIHVHLDGMSGQKNADLWTVASLESHEAWQGVRQFARAAIEAAEWQRCVPPTPEDDGDHFIRSGK